MSKYKSMYLRTVSEKTIAVCRLTHQPLPYYHVKSKENVGELIALFFVRELTAS